MTSTLIISPDYYSRAFEFTAFQGRSFLAPQEWPVGAGAATIDSSGRPVILHIAATRWLLPDPSSAVLSEENEIIARTERGLWAWIGSSHARSFLQALG